ncbi:patatin-like phospholipase family protein, partial [Paramuribaculum intestinale]
MTDRIICLLAMICIFASASAHDAHLPADSVHHTGHQAVGLVLSGGGAKGIAHIAVIKALEENDIPIDYIAGTSMGAVVGGLYAAGYTPDEMMALIKSEGFADWSTGKIDPDYLYYFDREPSSP